MKTFTHALIGGIAVIIVAGIIGVAQNAVRSNPVKLVQNVATTKADHSATNAADGETAEGEAPALGQGEVDLAGMQERWGSGLSIILDARSPGEYAEGHIPGAINIPYESLAEHMETLAYEATPDQPVVTYCKGPKCDLSHQLATELRLLGYENVVVFKAGWEGWIEAELETVTGTEP